MSVVNRRLAPDARKPCRAQGPVRRALPAAAVALREACTDPPVRRGRRGGRRLLPRPGDTPRTEVDRGRPGRAPRSGRSLARRALPALAGHRRGTALRAAAVAGGAAAGGRRGVDAGRPVPASAAAAGGLPRPVAIG